jgi:hypothetical protein
MIVLSLNCRGLGNPSIKLALHRLVQVHNPSILWIQETMSEGNKVVKSLSSLLLGWDFLATDALGKFSGLLTGWRSSSSNCIILGLFILVLVHTSFPQISIWTSCV